MLKEVKKYYHDSTKLFSLYYVDEYNLRQGEYKQWHENGQLRSCWFFKDNLLHGEYKNWYDNGQLRMQCFFVDDKRNGEMKVWHPNGQLEKYCTYNDDLIHGEYKLWYEHGLIRIHCFHKNGSLHGEYKRWHPTGQLESHSYLLNGVSITPQVISLIEDINNITEEERLLIMLKFGIPLLPAGETLC